MINKSVEKTEKLIEALEGYIRSLKQVVVGFSGGVDSSVVALAAHRALATNAIAVTGITETLTTEDRILAESISKEFGFAHHTIAYSELELEGYSENDPNRCFYCKRGLYRHLSEVALRAGKAVILDGSNLDDCDDYRPGRKAAREFNVVSPLIQLGMNKAQVRSVASLYGLPNSDKPSAPCLSSRVPYGTKITTEILSQIDAAERSLRSLGFRELRVRHHGNVARIELNPSQFDLAIELRERVEQSLVDVGYKYVALDLAGLRSGSLNEVLPSQIVEENGFTQIEIPVIE